MSLKHIPEAYTLYIFINKCFVSNRRRAKYKEHKHKHRDKEGKERTQRPRSQSQVGSNAPSHQCQQAPNEKHVSLSRFFCFVFSKFII